MLDLIERLSTYQRRREDGFVEETGMLDVGSARSFYVMVSPERVLSRHRVVITHSFFEMYMLQHTEIGLLRALARAGVPAIYVQAPGMGESEGDPRRCLCEDRVEAMTMAEAYLRRANDAGRPCFFGARVGGLIATLAAQRYDGAASLCAWDPVLDWADYWKKVSRLERIAAAIGRKSGFEEPERHLSERGRVTLLGVETTPEQQEDLEAATAAVRLGRISGPGFILALNDASARSLRATIVPIVEGEVDVLSLGLRDPWQLGLRRGNGALEPTVAWIAENGA